MGVHGFSSLELSYYYLTAQTVQKENVLNVGINVKI